MLNLTIPPQVNTPPSDSTSSTNADASTNNSPENEQFNKILAKETDKSANSANTANNKTAPAEKLPAEQSNTKALPQTPENASKLAQHHFPKKLISFELELEPKLDSDMPVLNAEAVRMAAKFGLAPNSHVSKHSVFARKNYFYPDLPKR